MKNHYLGWLAACLLLLTGCTLRLVAPYDLQTVQQAQSIERDIEFLYLSLQALPENERLYSRFADQYLKIDVNIRGLERRQARREQNQETLKQAQTLVQFWQQDMKTHQQKHTLSDFLIKRRLDQYQRLIDALIRGELAKQ
ncbi:MULTISPECIES: hypothetical protein [Vibrio]|uniref:hypothetical protein n=1 Tax=Vibrio TaxID=662 RepID=UPI002075B257|nr:MULTISPECIES: hypothetical protein [Vibrio]USD34650.1 hypothetical protein J8Z27_21765 [Vibrio sp. SCSIO 43186]USD47717.1 hypothetical protein J4N38_22160 [Vibrio sp. SCSIO 43145]USD71775.1 hypothetical protein J4N41_21780 [Vibrio sp. SCSIO 43139]USD98677.1 hypothetical protein CTT30_21965 [Vibrio coralliilyticus]